MPFQSPKGTRDFYPTDLLRRRYIIDTWRRVSLRHGFEEIDGPTFEDSALYTVKSGEGILNELFGAYSGKDPNDTKQVQSGGPPPFALRPEFTPTLARMYAARVRQLPQPTKWFCVSNFFRAERPQRGRLREFWQWNADVIGASGAPEEADAETVFAALDSIMELGLSRDQVRARFNSRDITRLVLWLLGVSIDQMEPWFALLDRHHKVSRENFIESAERLGMAASTAGGLHNYMSGTTPGLHSDETDPGSRLAAIISPALLANDAQGAAFSDEFGRVSSELNRLGVEFHRNSIRSWTVFDLSVVRGLAYYTGTVFELIAEGERAVAGGGRYDNLIELFGGPPTSAVGFGMGDVVLTNLLDDRKLMPEGKDLLEATSRPLPVRPDVFVIANESEEAQAKLVPTVAALRRGVETDKYKQGECKPWSDDRYAPALGGVPPLHARRSYKTTKNIGKLLADATACHARHALIIENADQATLKNLDTREEQKNIELAKAPSLIARNT